MAIYINRQRHRDERNWSQTAATEYRQQVFPFQGQSAEIRQRNRRRSARQDEHGRQPERSLGNQMPTPTREKCRSTAEQTTNKTDREIHLPDFAARIVEKAQRQQDTCHRHAAHQPDRSAGTLAHLPASGTVRKPTALHAAMVPRAMPAGNTKTPWVRPTLKRLDVSRRSPKIRTIKTMIAAQITAVEINASVTLLRIAAAI